MNENLGQFKAALIARHGIMQGQGGHQEQIAQALGAAPRHEPAEAGHPLTHQAVIEMHKDHIRNNLKNVRHAELRNELHETHKSRLADINKEHDELFK